jgi:hypothetical protein
MYTDIKNGVGKIFIPENERPVNIEAAREMMHSEFAEVATKVTPLTSMVEMSALIDRLVEARRAAHKQL